MKRRQRFSADPPTRAFNWLDAATEVRRQRDQSFKHTVKRLQRHREAWMSKAEEWSGVQRDRPPRG